METALRLLRKENLSSLPIRRDYVNNANKNEPKYGVLFVDFIRITVARKSRRMSKGYGDNYITITNHLNKFCEMYNVTLFTNSINEAFLDDFVLYLEECNARMTYIKNLLSGIKSMVRKAASYGYAVDPTFDDVDVDMEDSFNVYLSMNEITRIYYFKGLSEKQERIRDLFVVGCCTALRYSDYSTLDKTNFIGDEIIKVTKKTNKKVIIPIHDYVREIYKKYDGAIPGAKTIQHFNRYIQMICQKVGLTEEVTYSYTKGGNLITETKEKWQMISSHTARRSAATNMYLTGRWKLFQIMAITGHTSESSLLGYIKVTKEDVSKQMAGDSYFQK